MFKSFLLIVLLLNCQHTVAAKNSTGNILVVGDSISAAYGMNPDAGWVNLLAIKIAQEKIPYQVINASISGDTTISGLNRLRPLLQNHQPSIVIIELGGNDGLRGLSLTIMKKNIRKMIEISQRYNAAVLLAGMKIPPNYGKRYTTAFYNIYLELSNDKNIKLIPFLLEGIGDKRQLMQSDGVHPTESAQQLILDNVWTELEAMLIE